MVVLIWAILMTMVLAICRRVLAPYSVWDLLRLLHQFVSKQEYTIYGKIKRFSRSCLSDLHSRYHHKLIYQALEQVKPVQEAEVEIEVHCRVSDRLSFDVIRTQCQTHACLVSSRSGTFDDVFMSTARILKRYVSYHLTLMLSQSPRAMDPLTASSGV